jgi:hypothetical protein
VNRICLTALLVGASLQAQALGRLSDVSIIDRETGAAIVTHYHKGEYWIAGRPGAQYAIAIRNQVSERVLAVTAVDGVNVISGDTASWDQTGYVFEPRQRYQITGWRKSNAEVADFEFTDAPNSYAARTGRSENVGVIGVALFRERAAQLAETSPPAVPPTQARSNAPSSFNSAADAAIARGASPLPEKLGTGHGPRESSLVTQTDFERLQSMPNEVIRIRYDSLENLLAMGIIRQPPPVRPAPEPFPASPIGRYVPDPP